MKNIDTIKVGDYLTLTGEFSSGTARVFATTYNRLSVYVGYNMGSAEFAAAVRGSMPNKYEVIPAKFILSSSDKPPKQEKKKPEAEVPA